MTYAIFAISVWALWAFARNIPAAFGRKRDHEAGSILLLELLIVSAIMLVLAALAIPNLVQLRAAQNQTAALDRVRIVARAEATASLCAATPECTLSAGVGAILPAPGTITQSGYSFTFLQNGSSWTYSATPTRIGITGIGSFSVSADLIVHCSGGVPC